MDPLTFTPWHPIGTKLIITAGSSNYVALVDDNTVLKYPLAPLDEEDLFTPKGQAFRRTFRQNAAQGLLVEERILRTLGQHPRIIRLKQKKHKDGLLIEYAPNGSVESYLRRVKHNISLDQRLKWALQTAEGLAYVHDRNVLHCDLGIGNLLLESNLNIKLSDFQGKLLQPDGTVILDGGVRENTMSWMPRADQGLSNRKTDIFALGTVIYIITTGCLPFPGLISMEDEDEVQRRFRMHEFPTLERRLGGDVVRKRWNGAYESVSEAITDLQELSTGPQGAAACS